MRRLLLLVVVPLLLAAGWVAAPALSRSPWVPPAEDFEAAVPPAAGAPAAAAPGRARPRTVRAPGRFDLLGFRWRGGADVHMSLRVRRAGGRWSAWVPVADADAAPGHSDPVWAGGADEYQLRGARPPGLRAHFVNVTGTATRGDRLRTALRRGANAGVAMLLPSTARAQSGGSGAPSIRSRAAWDPEDQCAPRDTPSRGTVKMAFVHHTVSANTYAPEDVAGIMLGICRYHQRSNGWSDIGYNFLVDRYGGIWEGRAGGVTRAVVGAQAQGWNSQSTGISNIGTFTSEGQTPAAIRALGRLLGWKLALHGVPTRGTVPLTSAGGSTNRYPAGTSHSFGRISGHRDGNATSCPGDALYAQLPEVRRLAEAAAAGAGGTPRLTLEAARPAVTYPARAALSGRLTLPGTSAPRGAEVAVQRLQAGAWVTLARAPVGSGGSWSARLRLARSATLRARWAGGGGFGAVRSASLPEAVRPSLTQAPSTRTAEPGERIRVAGRSRPWKRRVTVALARRGATRWIRVKTWRLVTRRGRWAVRTPVLTREGEYRMITTTRKDANHAAGRSKTLPLVVEAPGGGAGFTP